MTSNAIAISRDLEKAGFSKQQADAIAESVTTHNNENLATKEDIGVVKNDITRLEGKVDTNHANLEGMVKTGNTKLETKITFLIWGIGIVGGMLGSIFGSAIYLLFRHLS